MFRSPSDIRQADVDRSGGGPGTVDRALKNVVVINDNAHVTGGADKIALTSAIGLAERGRNVFLLTAVGPVAEELRSQPNLKVVCTEQYEILHDPNRLRAAVQGLWNFKSGQVAADLLDTLSPSDTVVHLHLWAKSLSSSVVRSAVNRGFRVVCTLHDYLLACPNGTLFDHSLQQICQRDPMSLNCIQARCDRRGYTDKVWRVARGTVQASVGRLPSGLTDIISISDLVLSIMTPYLEPSTRIHTLANFIEVPRNEPANIKVQTSFSFVGRLVQEKGPLLFAKAAYRTQVQAVFLGEGECREAILSINPNATISGWLDSEETFRRLRSSRAMVFPSLWYEAQGLVVLEAMASGVPCVVADTSAAREMIVDGETGLLFKGGDLLDLERKMTALKDAEFASRLGRNAYDCYWDRPKTIANHLDGLEHIYEAMLQNRAKDTTL